MSAQPFHNSTEDSPISFGQRFPGLVLKQVSAAAGSAAGLTLLCFAFFYVLHSQQFAGDGELISRITEGGKWLVKNELLSQALIQGVYRVGQFWHLTPLEVMNALSCLSGALSVYILLRLSKRHFGLSPTWPLLLFFSTGYLIYSCGHTEYYPLLLPTLLIYGGLAMDYLKGNTGVLGLTLVFVLASALHFAMLIALPSLLLLPWLSGCFKDWRTMLVGLTPFVPLVLIRNYPQWVGYKAASLSPAWNLLPWFPSDGMYRYYAFFEWGHWADWIYAWTLRSWIVWPVLFWAICRFGPRSLRRPNRIFLLIYTLCFTLWSTVWHPDLGIVKDWDLFAIETAPVLLLILSYLPEWSTHSFERTMLWLACLASIAIGCQHVWVMADFPHASLEIRVELPYTNDFTIDGFSRELHQPRLRCGNYQAKLIDRRSRRVHDMNLVILPNCTTTVSIRGSTRNK